MDSWLTSMLWYKARDAEEVAAEACRAASYAETVRRTEESNKSFLALGGVPWDIDTASDTQDEPAIDGMGNIRTALEDSPADIDNGTVALITPHTSNDGHCEVIQNSEGLLAPTDKRLDEEHESVADAIESPSDLRCEVSTHATHTPSPSCETGLFLEEVDEEDFVGENVYEQKIFSERYSPAGIDNDTAPWETCWPLEDELEDVSNTTETSAQADSRTHVEYGLVDDENENVRVPSPLYDLGDNAAGDMSAMREPELFREQHDEGILADVSLNKENHFSGPQPLWGQHIEATSEDNRYQKSIYKRKLQSEPPHERCASGEPPPKRVKLTGQRKPTPAPYKASVKVLAGEGSTGRTGSAATVDNDIMLRIKKCIERSNHPNTPRPEAERAWFLASRLMSQYNVGQAEVLETQSQDENKQYSGRSVVAVMRADCDNTKLVRHGGFVDRVCLAMELFFNCSSFTTAFTLRKIQTRFEVSFYGIAQNTVAAALAFEMAYNLICEWARPCNGTAGKNSYCLGISSELCEIAKKARESEEKEVKRKEKREAQELAARLRREEIEKQAQLDRLADLPKNWCSQTSTGASKPTGTSQNGADGAWSTICRSGHAARFKDRQEAPLFCDQYDDDVNNRDIEDDIFEADFEVENEHNDTREDLNQEVDEFVSQGQSDPKQQAKSTQDTAKFNSYMHAGNGKSNHVDHKSTKLSRSDKDWQRHGTLDELEPEAEVKWASHMQLITFRETALTIAENYAKEQGIKLKKGRKRSKVIRDCDAYKQGVKDAKKIDVYRRSIKESGEDDAEK